VLTGFGAGGTALGALAGQLRDSWQHRQQGLAARAREAEDQLERLSRSYAVLQLSHTHLADRLAADTWSIEACLEEAARAIRGASSLDESAQALLEVLATHGSVQAAAVYEVEGAQLRRVPLAVLGEPVVAVTDHPIVQRALDTRQLVALCGQEPWAGDDSVLAAIPLLSTRRRLLAVIVVHHMPFMAFHSEHLERLVVICSRLADLVEEQLVQRGPDTGVRARLTRSGPAPVTPLRHGTRP